MRVFEIMSTPVYTVAPGESATAAWDLMRFRDARHLVVQDADGYVVGILSASDLGGRAGAPVREGRRVSDLMTERVVVAHPETTVREAANMMRGHAVHCLPVVKEGRLTGVVTVIDLLELLGRGAERPSPIGTRAVMRNRGVAPRQARARKMASVQ